MERYISGTAAEKRYERREEPRRHRQGRKVQKSKQRGLTVDLPYVIMLSVAGIAALVICCSYLKVQSSITTSLKNIAAYETQLENLKNENDDLESNINSSVNLDYVFQVATQELGMVYAHKDQILTYDKTESGYVIQNGDIPR